MAVDDSIRQIPRSTLFAIFKSEELVRLFESVTEALRTSVPTDISAVQSNIDAHVADTVGAHQASAIGNIPSGGISANTVQAALNELDAEKQPTLVSGTSIKTVNGTSLLGAGNLALDYLPVNNPVLTGNEYFQQGATASIAVAVTLTAAQMLGGIIEYTGAAAPLTLPTGTQMDAAVVAGLAVDRAFEVCFINTGTGAATITAGTSFTIVGSATVANGTSATYRCRKTAANTYIAYRVS